MTGHMFKPQYMYIFWLFSIYIYIYVCIVLILTIPNKYKQFSQAYRSDRACDAVQQIVHSHLLGIHLLYHVVLRRIQLVQQHLAGVDLDGECWFPKYGLLRVPEQAQQLHQ